MPGEAKAKAATPSPPFMASSWRPMTSRIAVSLADCATTAELIAHTKTAARIWAYCRIGTELMRLPARAQHHLAGGEALRGRAGPRRRQPVDRFRATGWCIGR